MTLTQHVARAATWARYLIKRPRLRSARALRVACAFAALASSALLSIGVAASPASAAAARYGVHLTPQNTFFLQLDVYGASTQDGAGLIDWWTNGGANQSWNFVPTYGDYEIQNGNSGQCLTTDGVAGDQVYQEPCNAQFNQLWIATPPTDGTSFTIKSASSGMYLDVYGNSSWPGATVDTWPWTGNSNQEFLID